MSATAFQRRRRELEAQLAEQEQQQEQVEQEPEQTGLKIEEMTKAQIIEALEELGVEFNNRDNKEVLKGLLVDASK